MPSFELLCEDIRAHTGMYVSEATYPVVAALVLGYDLATAGGALRGFREWLIPQVNTGNNLSWNPLILHLAFMNVSNPIAHVLTDAETQRHAIDTLFGAIAAFVKARNAPEGMRRIFAEYERWLRSQDWYTSTHPLWVG